MSQEAFSAILSPICADLASYLAKHCKMSEQEALHRLYCSGVYAALEQEETKLWQYSTPMLGSLLEQEWKNGTVRYPDV